MKYLPQSSKTLYGGAGLIVIISITVLLFCGALVFFFYKNIVSDSSFVTTVRDGKENVQTKTKQMNESARDDKNAFVFLPLSEDERGALKPPMSPDASQEDMSAYSALIQKVAVSGEKVTIGANCKIQPVVLKIQKGINLELSNYDSTPHEIRFDEKHSFLVPAHLSITASVDFPKEVGIYGYACDQSSGPAGILFITE